MPTGVNDFFNWIFLAPAVLAKSLVVRFFPGHDYRPYRPSRPLLGSLTEFQTLLFVWFDFSYGLSGHYERVPDEELATKMATSRTHMYYMNR